MPPEKRWLIISYFSRIDGMACAQHIDDRIPYLKAKGITPIMLTGVCGGRWPDLAQGRAPSVSPSGLRFELRHLRRVSGLWKLSASLLLLPLLPFYLLEKAIIDLDSQWSWFPLAFLRGLLLCRRHRPEAIYATGGAPSAHLAAAWIARCTGIPWIAEFQDPLVHEDWLRSRRALRVFRWLEALICRNAGAVVFLTDAARDNAAARTGLGARGVTAYPGADPANMPEVAYLPGPHCRFAHFGSFGGSRNLKVFLQGLQGALAAAPELVPLLRLDLYGTCDRLSRELIGQFPHPEVISDHGRVPRRESLVAMKRCDVLLLIQNTEAFSSETIPSKSYEYMLSGRPVLGLLFRNPELEGMLCRRGDLAVAADHPGQVQAAILELAECWRRGELGPRQDASPYTVERAVDSVAQLIESLVAPAQARQPGLGRDEGAGVGRGGS